MAETLNQTLADCENKGANPDEANKVTPDIQVPVTYPSDVAKALNKLLKDPNFTHESWPDDELKPYRKLVRDYYRNIQNGLCAFCKQNISLVAAGNCHIEHIVPKAKHPQFIFEPKNLCVICSDCNTIKRAKEVHKVDPDVLTNGPNIQRYPRSSNAFLIVHPHFDKWEDHIERFGNLYADLSDKGLFTMGACTLNRKLREFGWEAIVASEADVRRICREVSDATDAIVLRRKMSALQRLLLLV